MRRNMSKVILNDQMTPAEVAGELDVTVGTLSVWRTTQRYPLVWYKLGRNVFYRRQDVEAFIESRRRGQSPVVA